jgi:LPS-assembly protein
VILCPTIPGPCFRALRGLHSRPKHRNHVRFLMRRAIGCAALLCALFFPSEAAAQSNPFSSCDEETFRFQGNIPEPIADRPEAFRITLIGPVEIVCNDVSLFADQVVYETDTRWIVATGNVTVEQPGLQVFAERAEIDGNTKLGTFFNANGTARIGGTTPDRNMFGTQEPDVMFYGEEIARVAPTTYTLKNAYFTTCVQPTPRWEFSGTRGTIKLDRYALLRHVVLRVKDVPLLYLPAIYYPINKEDRSTGFLLPTYGTSTYRGTSISNAFFWAISRSQDATFFHDWYTKTGQGLGTEYRYVASPGSQGRMNFTMQNLRELGTGGTIAEDAPTTRTFRLDGDVNQALPGGFRLLGTANYVSDVSSLQSYQNINAYSQRQSGFRAQLSGTIGRRLRLAATAEQRDMFYGTQRGQRFGRAPSINLSLSDTPIGRTRIYYGASGEVVNLIRQTDTSDPRTNASLWRFDGGPSIRAPLSSLPFLTATGTASWRVTRWMETIDPLTREQVPVAMTRQLFDLRAQVVGPVLARVFQTPNNGYANGFKHLIEPSFSIQRTMPYFDESESARVVGNDPAVDYLVGGVTTIRYGITNRLLARRPNPAAAPGTPAALGVAREILSVEIGQSYYSDVRQQRADSQYDLYNPTPVSSPFSPIQMTVVSRPTDVASGQFRADLDPDVKKFRTMSASGSVQSRQVQVTTGWSRRLVIAELPGFDEGRSYHSLDASTTVRTDNNRAGGTYSFNFDVKNTAFIQQRIVAYFNSQCCGVSFDWQSISVPLLGLPADRRFGISFTLAGIGSFSNPMGSFGGR